MALIALLALSAFLATAAPLWLARSTDTALSGLVAAAEPGVSGLEFEGAGHVGPDTTGSLDEVAAEGDEILSHVPASIAGVLQPHIDLVDSDDFLAFGAPQQTTYLTFRIARAMSDAIRVYAGRAPTGQVVREPSPNEAGGAPVPRFEIGLSRSMAEALLVDIGDTFDLVDVAGGRPFGGRGASFVRAEIVGLFDVVDPADPRWFSDTTLDIPSIRRLSAERFEYHAVAWLSPDAYAPLAIGPPNQQLRYRWRFALDPRRIAAAQFDQFALDLGKLQLAFPFGAGPGGPNGAGLSTGLRPILEEYRVQRSIATTAVTLASVGAIVACGGALVLVASGLRRRRIDTVQLARARGADLARLLGVAVVEAAILVAPPAALGAFAAQAVFGTTADPRGSIAVAVLTATALVLGAIGASRSPLGLGRQAGDRTRDARLRRWVLDAVVVVVAVSTAVAIRAAGAQDPTRPPDPMRAAAPALFAVAGAIVLVRVFDVIVAGLARLVRRIPGFVAVHAIRGLARTPRAHELPLMVLLVAVASGVFATVVASTIERTQGLAAAITVGADYRIESANTTGLPTDLDLDQLAAIGLAAIDARDTGRLFGSSYAGQNVDVVGLDAHAYAAVTAGSAIAAGFPAAFFEPGAADGSPERPVPIILAPRIAPNAGWNVGDQLRLDIGSSTAQVIVVAIADPVPAIELDRGILAPLEALRAAFPDRALGPTQAFVRATPDRRPALDAYVAPYHGALRIVAASDVEAALRAKPLVGTMSNAFLYSLAVAALFGAIVVGVSVAQALAIRSGELALLRAIGLPGSRGLSIVVLELGATILVALGGGLLLGLATATLVVPGLGIERFVGVGSAAPARLDPSAVGLAVLGPAVAAVLALVAAGLLVRPAGIGRWIRSAET
jgi:putative ABC transport system permease protein